MTLKTVKAGLALLNSSTNSGVSDPCSWTPSSPARSTTSPMRPTEAFTKTPMRFTAGWRWLVIAAASLAETRLRLRAKMKPTALAPALTAARASPSRVIPQIFMKVRSGWIIRDLDGIWF
jgi:hypothetical protein